MMGADLFICLIFQFMDEGAINSNEGAIITSHGAIIGNDGAIIIFHGAIIVLFCVIINFSSAFPDFCFI
ncbi:hypothetical protein [Mesobacillus sp.]|uniref:hypothetical protein n=1 Tax=Mesobacillus sp. TaxID=2675271 RepID=UPI0039EEFD22